MISKLKIKGQGHGGTPEVNTARSKLDGVLQTLRDKKDESPIKEEHGEDFEALEEAAATGSPSKRGKQQHPSKHGRKRKRTEDVAQQQQEFGQYHHTYVMKLFDRSVDLAQFDDTTPLYPVCRAWMKNQPHNQELGVQQQERSPTPGQDSSEEDDEDSEAEDMKPVFRLPPPVVMKSEVIAAGAGQMEIDLRIPSPLPYPTDEPTLDQIYEDPSIQPAPEQLLLNHMDRWKQVRQKWKDSSRHNEARYMPSLTVLKDMYDRSCKD